MSVWYEIRPTDTLFLRGAEPLEAGQPSREALFPPPASVLIGAVRTALLRQRGIAFTDYKAGQCPQEILERIGPCGQPAPFRVTAILLIRADEVYAPCPASWFVDKDGAREHFVGSAILRATALSAAASTLQACSSAGTDLPMVLAKDAKSLAGNWVKLKCLQGRYQTIAEGDVLPAGDFYDLEARTGIAIDHKRKVQEGKIYSATHIRLREGVCLLAGLNQDPGLSENGLLYLGGEQRVCGYARVTVPALPTQKDATLYMSLAPVELGSELLPHVFAASRPVMLAGWDLARGFHKATTTWLPAGSVFTTKINACCIPLND